MRRSTPWRGVHSPPGQELLGAITSRWALPRILQAIPKIKRLAGESDRSADPAHGGAYSKDVNSAFVRRTHDSVIAARSAGRRRGHGRGGKPRRATGTRRRVSRNGMGKAG